MENVDGLLYVCISKPIDMEACGLETIEYSISVYEFQF